MSMMPIHSDSLIDRLIDLTDRCPTDGTAVRQLNDLLIARPELRDLYLDYLTLHGLLNYELGGVRPPVKLATDAPNDWTAAIPAHAHPLRSLRHLYVFAAATAIAAALAAYFLLFAEPQTRSREHSITTMIATLTDLDNAVFANNDTPALLGGALPPGPIRLRSGQAQIMFASTAVVDLSGPCRFELTGPNRGRLVAGRLEASVPAAAHGFTVDLPQGIKVVDLGTRFRLAVGPQTGDVVRVLEGHVRVSRSDEAPGSSNVEVRDLTAGQMLRFNRGRFIPCNVIDWSFDTSAAPPELMTIGAGAAEYSDQASHFIGEDKRFYLATRRTDFAEGDFVFEGTVTLASQASNPNGTAFFGIGPLASLGPFNEPGNPTVYAEIAPQSFANGFVRFHHNDVQSGPLGQGNGGWTNGSVHRVRLIWDAAAGAATLELDQNFTGDFHVDFRRTFNVIRDGLNPHNARLFFGAGNGTSWDDVTIMYGPGSLPPSLNNSPTPPAAHVVQPNETHDRVKGNIE